MTIDKQNVVDVVNADGYKAKITVTWHKATPLQEGDFVWFSNCLSNVPDLSPQAPRRQAARGVLVSVFAEFPAENGFVWPKNQPVTASALGDGAFHCTEEGVAFDNGRVDMAPGVKEQVNFLVYELEDITPKNPDGAFPAESPNFHVSLNALGIDCGTEYNYGQTCQVPSP